MKKAILIGLMSAVCASCISKTDSEISVIRQRKGEETPTSVQTQAVMAPVSGNVAAERVVGISEEDALAYAKNIVVKTMGDDYVVYEYSDVRIDKVAPLASRYCYETNPGKKAYLRDIYMHKNHKRRATFDCVSLASE